jgi:hypothetical protein
MLRFHFHAPADGAFELRFMMPAAASAADDSEGRQAEALRQPMAADASFAIAQRYAERYDEIIMLRLFISAALYAMRKRGAAGVEFLPRRRAACCAADYAGLPISRFIDVEALPPSPPYFRVAIFRWRASAADDYAKLPATLTPADDASAACQRFQAAPASCFSPYAGASYADYHYVLYARRFRPPMIRSAPPMRAIILMPRERTFFAFFFFFFFFFFCALLLPMPYCRRPLIFAIAAADTPMTAGSLTAFSLQIADTPLRPLRFASQPCAAITLMPRCAAAIFGQRQPPG